MLKDFVHWPKDSIAIALKYILNNIISEHPYKSPESSKNHMNKSFIKLILNSKHRNEEMERCSWYALFQFSVPRKTQMH